MPNRFRAFVAVGVFFCAAWGIFGTEPLVDGLGSCTRNITTASPKAQRYFNQGLAYLHGFNHSAAIRSFQEAAWIDPDCAMAHWGIALAAGAELQSLEAEFKKIWARADIQISSSCLYQPDT